jgi:hypothetical protein
VKTNDVLCKWDGWRNKECIQSNNGEYIAEGPLERPRRNWKVTIFILRGGMWGWEVDKTD